VIRAIKLNVTVAVTGYILTLLHGHSLAGLAEMLLLVKLNVFALPLAVGTSLFQYPLWVWYVVVLLWVLQVLHYAGVRVRDVFDAVLRS